MAPPKTDKLRDAPGLERKRDPVHINKASNPDRKLYKMAVKYFDKSDGQEYTVTVAKMPNIESEEIV